MNKEKLEKSKQILFVALGIDILVNAVFFFRALHAKSIVVQLASGSLIADQALSSNFDFWERLSGIPILTLCGVGIALVMWLNSCYHYSFSSIGATHLKNKRWTAFGWIVPVLNLFKPYQIINELYKVGSPNYSASDDWQNETRANHLLLWWAFYLVTHFFILTMAQTGFGISSKPDISLHNLISLYGIQAWLCGTSILISLAWFSVVNLITNRLSNRKPIEVVNEIRVSQQINSVGGYKTTAGISEADDDALFTQVAKEIVHKEIDEGLWAKAYALENGDERKTKAHYMRLRVERLQRRNLSDADSNTSKATDNLSGSQNISYKVPLHLATNPRSPKKLTCPACDFYGHMIVGENPARMRIVDGLIAGVAVYFVLMLIVMFASSIPEAASIGPILGLGALGYAIYFGYTKAKRRFDYLYCPNCAYSAPVTATVS